MTTIGPSADLDFYRSLSPSSVLARMLADFGARPGVQSAPLTTQAIQAAIDSFAASNPPTATDRKPGDGVELYLPPGKWFADQPIHMAPLGVPPIAAGHITLRSAGPRIGTLGMHPSREGSLLYLGVIREGSFSPDHWIDAFGLLDSTAAPSAGFRWALRTKGDAHVAFGCSAMHRGPNVSYWKSHQKLTVEMAFHGPVRGSLCGASYRGDARPVAIYSRDANNDLLVLFSTDDGTLTGCRRWTVRFPRKALMTEGVHRLVVQVDTGLGMVSCWQDGFQVAMIGMLSGIGLIGSSFAPAQGSPWMIGVNAGTANAVNSDYAGEGGQANLTVLGLKVSSVLRYVPDGPSSPLRRIDGRPNTDHRSYFEVDGSTLFYLPIQDKPAEAALLRRVTYGTPNGRGFGLWLSKEHATNNSSIRGVSLRDVGLIASPLGGEACSLGLSLDTEIDHCRLIGGDRGLGSLSFGANYRTFVSRCELMGRDAALFAFFAMMTLRECRFPSVNARAAIWASMSDLVCRDNFVEGAGIYENLYRGSMGSTASFDGLDYDHEDAKCPLDSAFFCEAVADRGSLPAGLRIRGFAGGGLRADRPMIRAVNRLAAGKPAGLIAIEPPWTLGSQHPVFVAADPGWMVWVGNRQGTQHVDR